MTKSILTNKIFLYLTEFFAGMSVMAVELGASRLLAPYLCSVVFLAALPALHFGIMIWPTRGESVYNYLQVKEDSKSVNLSTNVLIGVQSVYRKDEALSGMYYDYAMAAPYMAGIKELEASGQDMKLLILGMGSGTYATQLSRYFDNINITGVEIDEKITDLAHEYFELPEDT